MEKKYKKNDRKQKKTAKFFLGSLDGSCTNKKINEHFSNFGEVVEVNLKFDKKTKKCNGFGFLVLCFDPELLKLIVGHHRIQNRQIKV
jgi:RNA recognition motif-containing protein